MSRRGASARRGLPAPAPGVSTPADRHYRRADLRAPKRRRLGQVVVRVARMSIVPAVLVLAGWWVAASLAGARFLHVDRLAIRGNARLSAADVEALVPGLRGENILAVDFDRYRRGVMESPWVATVSLARMLPSTVEIRITERTPIAIARLGRQLYLVDATGVIIDAYGPQYRDFDLPIVDGLIDTGAPGVGAVDPERLALTARLLAALARRPDLADRVSQIDAEGARDAVVLLDDDPARLHLGDDQFVERLQTYLEIAPTLREQLAAIDYVDLRFGDRVFARAKGQTASVRRTALRQ